MKPRNAREAKQLRRIEESRLPAESFTRHHRRRLAATAGACLALLWANAGVSLALAPSDAAMYTNFAVLAVILPVGLWAYGRIIVTTRGTVGLPAHLLDERQAAERINAHGTAHRATLVLLLLCLAAVMSLMPGEGYTERLPGAAAVLLFVALIATVAALPALIIAWRLPDAPPDDEDDEHEHGEG
ncbi:hypothetical protein [Actinomadura hibisca]|uniref:hypothetical protein n=1 Tax=Actinomadura hibisca TaxID=68565 RepID=UPI00082EFD39|nr:hypothetical protein [Actinomadura hibisca]